MISKHLIFGFIISLIGNLLGFYLCYKFLLLTYLGIFNFFEQAELVGILISLSMIFIFIILLILIILGFALHKYARIFGIIITSISIILYNLMMYFTFSSIYLNMPVTMWPSIVLGSDGVCFILIGGIIYIITKTSSK
ncbi:MAG: hypothetical protein ACTSPY_15420 [Candidatus Helarchaeota archaeon]